MPPLSPIGYSVKTRSLSPYPTRFGQVEREPKPGLRTPSQWHCLMEVTARPGFQLFKTDPGYNDRAQPATRAVVNRQRRALSSRPLIRLRIAACGIAGGRRVTTHHNFIKALRDQGGAEVVE